MSHIKNITVAMFLGAFITGAYASEVYIDQVGSSSTIDITQTGSGNVVNGDDGTTTAALLSGSSMDIDIVQDGSNNEAEINITGSSTTLDYSAVGSGNQFDILVNGGTGGSHTVDINGEANDVTICGTAGGAASMTAMQASSTSGTSVTGISCSAGIAANDVTNSLTIGGDYNIVNMAHGAGVANSVNTITIGDGLVSSDNNEVNLVQDNAEANTVTLTIEGSSNLVNILQN